MLIHAIAYLISVGLLVYAVVTHNIPAGLCALAAGFISLYYSNPRRS